MSTKPQVAKARAGLKMVRIVVSPMRREERVSLGGCFSSRGQPQKVFFKQERTVDLFTHKGRTNRQMTDKCGAQVTKRFKVY